MTGTDGYTVKHTPGPWEHIATQLVTEHYARLGQAIDKLPGLTNPTKRELIKAFLRIQVDEMARLRDEVETALSRAEGR